MGLLMLVMPPMAAAKLWLTFYGIGFIGVCGAALRRLKPAEWAPALVVAVGALIFSSSFWNGYINFQVAALLLTAFLLVWEVHDRRKGWILAVFGIAIFFSHAVVFAAFVLYVGSREVLFRRNLMAIAELAPSLALLVWYVLAKDPANVEPVPEVGAYRTALEFVMYKVYTLAKLGPFHNFVGNGGVGQKVLDPPLYWTGVALNIAFAGILLLAIAMAFLELLTRPARAGGERWAMFLPVGILLCGFLAAPDMIADVVNIGERFLVASLVLLLLTIPLRRSLLMAAAVVILAAVPLNAWSLLSAAAPGSDSAQAVPASSRQNGLFSHRLYQFDAKAKFLSSDNRGDPPRQAFRTSIIVPSRQGD
jgi:hypothetical protein